jgi:nitric oxide dioxygenase
MPHETLAVPNPTARDAAAAATALPALTPLQIELVRFTWQRVRPMADAAARRFYDRLFDIAPEVRPMFRRDLRAQGAMLMATLDTVVASLDRLGDVLPVAQQLARRHVGYGVMPGHYDLVGEALLWTLEQMLGDDFTASAHRAWQVAYGVLADAMKAAAYPAPAAAPNRAPWLAAAVLAGVVAAPGDARAAAYIKFDGIDGSVTEATTLVVPFEAARWLQVAAGGRFEPGMAKPMESLSVNYTKIEFDRAKQAAFVFSAGAASTEPYLQIELEDVLVSSYSVSGAGSAAHGLRFEGYSAANVLWRPPATANDPTPAWRGARWDTATGAFSGTPVSMADVRAWGGVTLPDGTLSLTSPVPEPGTWALGLAGLSAVLAVARRRAPTRRVG